MLIRASRLKASAVHVVEKNVAIYWFWRYVVLKSIIVVYSCLSVVPNFGHAN